MVTACEQMSVLRGVTVGASNKRWYVTYDALASLHWLRDVRVPERIEYKVAVLTYKVLNGSALRYLGPLVPVADLPGRRTLRSAGTNRLLVPPVRLSTVGR